MRPSPSTHPGAVAWCIHLPHEATSLCPGMDTCICNQLYNWCDDDLQYIHMLQLVVCNTPHRMYAQAHQPLSLMFTPDPVTYRRVHHYELQIHIARHTCRACSKIYVVHAATYNISGEQSLSKPVTTAIIKAAPRMHVTLCTIRLNTVRRRTYLTRHGAQQTDKCTTQSFLSYSACRLSLYNSNRTGGT